VAWGTRDVSERRLQFVVRANSGKEEMKALCREFEISRPTGYSWLERYRSCAQLQEVGERSRRPRRSPAETAAATQQRLVELRSQYPDWGARKLVELLKREGIALPRITAHRILLRRGLIRPQDRHRAAVKRFEREAPNQLWQMDFKGMPDTRTGCLPLVLLDDHSRYLVGLFDTAGTQARPVRDKLESAFAEHGMPEAMLMDHGTPWWNRQSQSGWTLVDGVADAARNQAVSERHPASANAGQGGAAERIDGSGHAPAAQAGGPELAGMAGRASPRA
jgi:transposase